MGKEIDLNCDLDILRSAILESFPSYLFNGQVMSTQHSPEVYENEGDNLNAMLGGKEWKSLETGYIDANVDDYILLTPAAVVAFLAAWLWRSVDNPGGNNAVLDSLIFHLSSSYDLPPNKQGRWGGNFSMLDHKQKRAIQLLLECAAATATSYSERQTATNALTRMGGDPVDTNRES